MFGQSMQKIPTLIPVVAAALLDGNGRVLMQQRRLSKQHGGLWEFPGGKVEAGETLDMALVRELREELGITIDAASIEPLAFAARPGEPVVVMLYTCAGWQGEPQCLDAEAIGWFTLAELPALPMPPLDVPLAQALRNVSASAI